jgi:hypothetical protein
MRTPPLLRLALLLAVVASPAFATVADDLCASAVDPCVVNTSLTIDPGSVIDLGGRALNSGAAARVTIGAGTVSISAGAVRLLPGARITGLPASGARTCRSPPPAASRSRRAGAPGAASTCRQALAARPQSARCARHRQPEVRVNSAENREGECLWGAGSVRRSRRDTPTAGPGRDVSHTASRMVAAP